MKFKSLTFGTMSAFDIVSCTRTTRGFDYTLDSLVTNCERLVRKLNYISTRQKRVP
jgi:hypothetical protein